MNAHPPDANPPQPPPATGGPPAEPPPPPPPAPKPPLLDYPSVPTKPAELDTESWSEIGRAMVIVFGIGLALFTIGFGVCGVMFRGC